MNVNLANSVQTCCQLLVHKSHMVISCAPHDGSNQKGYMIKLDPQIKHLLILIAAPSLAVLTNEYHHQLYMPAVRAVHADVPCHGCQLMTWH